jgi:predicted permease
MMGTLMQDLRYAVRTLGRTPGFTLAAVSTLALGIGANAAIFSILNAILWKPYGVPHPDELVRLGQTRGQIHAAVSPANFVDYQKRSTSLVMLSGFENAGVNASDDERSERVRTAFVTADLLPLLGAQPVLGRSFSAGEFEPGRDHVVLLSHNFWRTRFGASDSALGRTLRLSGVAHQIVGVLPEGVDFPPLAHCDLWAPLAFSESDLASRGSKWVNVVARRAPGRSLAQARAETTAIAAELARAFPDENTGWSVEVLPFFEQVVGRTRPILLVLAGAAAFVLLIACANVANLLLARAGRRRREIAVRAALGASRRRLVRQLLTESAVLATAGSLVGILGAVWLSQAWADAASRVLPRAPGGLDTRVLLFCSAITGAATLLFGLAPSWQLARRSVSEAFGETSDARVAGGRRVGSLFVAAEVALCLVLLTGAALLIRSLERLSSVKPGFDPTNLLTLRLNLPVSQFPKPETWARFFDEVRTRVASLPGVEEVTSISHLPVSDDGFGNGFTVGGRPTARGDESSAEMRWVGPRYFETLKIPLRRGRLLGPLDRTGSPLAVVINEAFTREFFPGEDPVGRHLLIAFCRDAKPCPPSWQIVGVVGDVRDQSLELAASPQMYVAEAQLPMSYTSLLIRTRMRPDALAAAVQREVRALDPTIPVWDARSMDDVIARSSGPRRYTAYVLAAFAALALALAAVGVGGVMACVVSLRAREIAIRMALGAGGRDVVGAIVGRAFRFAIAGIVVGLAGALALTRLLSSLLFDVRPTDPISIGAAVVLMLGISTLAAWLPARRAARIDPMVALRSE